MASDLQVDTERLRAAAGHLGGAVDQFRRVEPTPPVGGFASTAFGSGGAAVEIAAQITKRLRQGSECAELLARRSQQLADNVLAVATRFDELEAALVGGPR